MGSSNLSLKPNASDLQADVDRDGLSDAFERKHGFDPGVARSQGSVLDGICFNFKHTNDCHNLEIQCERRENEFGISDCDIMAMNLNLNDSDLLGLDSDDDGIPDKIELLFELDPSTDDALIDYDKDGVTNLEEVRQFTHPRQIQSVDPPLGKKLILQRLEAHETSCEGEEWSFSLEGQKIYAFFGRPLQDLENNHIWIMAVSKKRKSPLSSVGRVQYIHIERNYQQPSDTLVFSTQDFQTAENDFF